MNVPLLTVFLFFFLNIEKEIQAQDARISAGSSVISRFNVPEGYTREREDTLSFGVYLRNLPLKPEGAKVHYYNGEVKDMPGIYIAVLDMDIGRKNLQQCADAVMRLWAEYLFKQQRYSEIHFNFTNGFRVDFTEWMKGKRMVVNGNKSYWVQRASPCSTYTCFRDYMDVIFSYAGTLSLSKELKEVSIENMQIGDVFIRGGSPGHAVIVMDMAVNKQTGEKIFMLAQSYMPAQDIQILENPRERTFSPWYSICNSSTVLTPEWSFSIRELKRFE